VKDAAKKGQKEVCVVLAKEMIRSRKAVSKLYASKAHMNSVLMGMKNQLGKAQVPDTPNNAAAIRIKSLLFIYFKLFTLS
jgi:division protein CdvB (Snf7/Vps24/ESCRT-III family)